jgi:hypothetical protein
MGPNVMHAIQHTRRLGIFQTVHICTMFSECAIGGLYTLNNRSSYKSKTVFLYDARKYSYKPALISYEMKGI